MANERLGIFEELQERRKIFERHGKTLRDRITSAGPAYNGAYAEPVNPFAGSLRITSAGDGYFRRPPRLRPGVRRRVVWAESKLGLNLVQVVQAVVIESGLTTAELLGISHKKRVSWPRHVAMWSIDRYCPDYSLTEISYIFKRDHTTVLYGIRSTADRLANGDVRTKTLVANVRQRLHTIAMAA